VKGKHNLKMGVDFRKLQNNLSLPSTSGYFFFDHNETALPSARATTGNGFASFLLGAVDNANYTINDVTRGMRYPYFAAYVQDDLKLRPNFTLNLGLRWDYLPTMVEVNDVYSIMDPTVPNPAAGGRLGALIYAGDGEGRTGRRRLTNGISYNNWGPRIGLAWQPKNHIVVRTVMESVTTRRVPMRRQCKTPNFGFAANQLLFSGRWADSCILLGQWVSSEL
jgi:outer membrane receptor protein involved in Fe transport